MRRALLVGLSFLVAGLPRSVQASPAPATAAPNIALIGAPSAWARGITGEGIVVALLDSGVDMSHADLAARWRGGSNSWLDPYGEHPGEPVDLNGHGTQVLGVILGGEADGRAIGVAPGARWIAAKIFDDRGHATRQAIHQALHWLLDPDGDPATHDAPQVVNNSWSSARYLCDPEFADDLRALRAAGILPVFAAGTSQPVSPADGVEAFSVGALAEDGESLYFDSARGPATCTGVGTIYPQIVAPGEQIYTTDRSNLYAKAGGTSLAAAHVSGALALLLNADRSLSADEQTQLLESTATDLGAPGPDNEFGYGRINVAAALDRLQRSSLVVPLIIVLGLVLCGIAVLRRQ